MRLWSLHPRYLDAKGLVALWREALLARAVLRGATRGYRFDRSRFGPVRGEVAALPLSDGQLDLEWRHLLAKLEVRDPSLHMRWRGLVRPEPHPLFRLQPGPVAGWERAVAPVDGPAQRR